MIIKLTQRESVEVKQTVSDLLSRMPKDKTSFAQLYLITVLNFIWLAADNAD